MKKLSARQGVILAIVVIVVAWIVHFHVDAVAGYLPKWGWLQKSLAAVAVKQADTADTNADDVSQDEVPVHAAAATRATFHRYIDGFGTIAPRPPRADQMAGGASISAPVPGIVADVLCVVGQSVHRGDALIQLDDRVAKAQEDQAAATLAEAKASLASLKATPRPDQLQIAQLAVDKSRATLEFAQKEYDRQQKLAGADATAAKVLEQSALDLASAKSDLAVNQAQLILLQNSPTPQELAVAEARVSEAAAALAAANVQREVLRITAPIDATVVRIDANPGEAVDTTHSIVTLVALDRLMVDIDVPAEQLPSLSVGQSAIIVPSATTQPGDSSDQTGNLRGKVAFISPEVDQKTGAVQIGIDLPPDDSIRPGLAVQVHIIAEEHADRLAVPTESVVSDDDGNPIVCAINDDTASRVQVKVGLREAGLTEIVDGELKEGQKVVTQGAYGLPDKAKVTIAGDEGATQP